MCKKKRGILLVVFFIILIVVGGVVLAEREGMEASERYNYIEGGTHDADGCWINPDSCCPGCTPGCGACHDYTISSAVRNGFPRTPTAGCQFHACDDDDPQDHDCGSRYAGIGDLIYHLHGGFYNIFDEVDHYPGCDWQDDLCIIGGGKWETNGPAYLCGNNGWWYECTENNLGASIWLNKKEAKDNYVFGRYRRITSNVDTTDDNYYLFTCTLDEEFDFPWWELSGVDNDFDGYIEGEECNDNNEEVEGCPEINLNEVQGMLAEELRSYVDDLCRPYRNNPGCAICINPSAHEVCGDFYPDRTPIDNDCDPATPNDCHQNKYACEQTAPLPTEEELEAGIQPKVQDNNLGTKFSWIPTANGGYCCGYNGLDDLGESASNDNGEYICLNEQHVGVEGGVDDLGWANTLADGTPDQENTCVDWCWIEASKSAKFKILTINKPTKTYDVVSNGEKLKTSKTF